MQPFCETLQLESTQLPLSDQLPDTSTQPLAPPLLAPLPELQLEPSRTRKTPAKRPRLRMPRAIASGRGAAPVRR